MDQVLVINEQLNTDFPGRDRLEEKGYPFDFFSQVSLARQKLVSGRIAGVIVSFESIKTDAVSFIREIKARLETGPVIVHSETIDELDTILALEAGADEVITGQMGKREAQSRVIKAFDIYKRLANREALTEFSSQECIRIAEFTIYLGSFKFLKNEETINLTPREFLFLMLLYKNRGKVVSREEVIGEWKWLYAKTSHSTRITDTFVYQLRKKIGLDESTAFNIVTVHQRGYSFRFNHASEQRLRV